MWLFSLRDAKRIDYEYEEKLEKNPNNNELDNLRLDQINHHITTTLRPAGQKTAKAIGKRNEKCSNTTKDIFVTRRELASEGKWDTTQQVDTVIQENKNILTTF